jgi:hypothetical protein
MEYAHPSHVRITVEDHFRFSYLEKPFEVHWFYLVPSLRVTAPSGTADATNNNGDGAQHELIVVDAKKSL